MKQGTNLTGKVDYNTYLLKSLIMQFVFFTIGSLVIGAFIGYAMAGGNTSHIDLSYFHDPAFQMQKFKGGFTIGVIIALVADAYAYIEYEKRKNTMRDKEHGSAKLMTPRDMPQFNQWFFYDPKVVAKVNHWTETQKKRRTFYNKDELKLVCKSKKFDKKTFNKCFLHSQILGQDVYLSMNAKFINRNLNTLTVGGSGQGKSYSELFPNTLNAPDANVNLIFTDPSGEIFQKCAWFLQSRGYKIKVFNVDEFNLSMKFNPILYIKDEKDYNVLVDSLVENIDMGKSTSSSSSGDFFVKAAKSLMCSLIALLRELFPILPIPEDATEEEKEMLRIQNEVNAGKQTLSNVMELLRMAKQEVDEDGNSSSTLDEMFSRLKAENKYSYAARMWENFSVGGPKVCNEVIISAAADYGRYFDNPQVSWLTSTDELHLEDLASETPCALFLVIPQSNKSYNFLCSVIYSQIFDIVTKAGKAWRDTHGLQDPQLPRHLSFFLDEFANTGKIPNFNELLSVVRKYNISINIIIQGMSQLKSMYPKEEWESILANLDSMIYLGGMEPSTVKWLSEKLGKTTIKQMSSTYSRQGSLQFSNMGRALLTPDEIEQMTRAFELVFISGCKPIQTRKFNLSEHPYYKLCGEGDPAKNSNIYEFIGDNNIDYSILERNFLSVKEILGYNFNNLHINEGIKKKMLAFDTNAIKLNGWGIEKPEEYLVIDTETTGLGDGAPDEIIELGITSFDGQIVYHSRFCPEKEVHPKAYEKNKLTKQLLTGEPKFEAEWPNILSIIMDKKLIAHNVPFEIKLLQQTLTRYGLDNGNADMSKEIYKDSVDTLERVRNHPERQQVAKPKDPKDAIKNDLESLAKEFGTLAPNEGESHSALADAMLLAETMVKMNDYMLDGELKRKNNPNSTMVQTGSSNGPQISVGGMKTVGLTEAEKRQRQSEIKRVENGERMDMPAEELIKRYDFTNTEVYANFTPDYEFTDTAFTIEEIRNANLNIDLKEKVPANNAGNLQKNELSQENRPLLKVDGQDTDNTDDEADDTGAPKGPYGAGGGGSRKDIIEERNASATQRQFDRLGP